MKLDDDPALQEYTHRVINTIEQLRANGKAENTIKSVTFTLKRLNRETDLMNPEAVKLHIGNLKVSNQTKQKLIKQATTTTYNGIEYPCYWLTDEGIMTALMEGASPENLLTRTKILYPDAKTTHAFLEIAPYFHPEVLKMANSSIKGKGKIGIAEIILLFLSQPAIAMDAGTAKNLTAILKKYPDEYSKFKTAIEEMKTLLSQLIKE